MGKISCLEQNLIDITDYYEDELSKYENESEEEVIEDKPIRK